MHMIELPLDAAALTRFAWHQGHAAKQGYSDEDFGYAAHAWLAATLGELAPRPFRLQETRRGLRLLGYALQPAQHLAEHARTFALPAALAVCDWDTAASKEMPTTWHVGQRLGFEVRACPVSRGERERDLYLVEVDEAKASGREPANRSEVYGTWLDRQFGQNEAAKAELITLAGFRRVRSLRQSRAGQDHRHHGVERPDALFTGELRVLDPDVFASLLARGIGRHRAFGFGMLLLRPPGRGGT
ncbi:type I-E CRISPR-associated protein Cas6/Cse3/CasE [Parasulfuritortus cantonensis]|nr:type I-E CRISPR-associated protein Cas6/Cse3/CasE [Parasulfuritortus cantonensis]